MTPPKLEPSAVLPAKQRLSEDQEREARQLYEVQRIPISRIAARLGVSWHTVEAAAKCGSWRYVEWQSASVVGENEADYRDRSREAWASRGW
jgi:hypothetical protein